MSPSEDSTAVQTKYCEFVANSFNSSKSKGSVSSDVTDCSTPLFVRDSMPANHDPELGSKTNQSNLYFGGYTLFEVCCIILIALSVLSILILLLTWGPITTLQLKYWKESNSRELANANNGIKRPTHESNVLNIMPNSIFSPTSKNDSAPFFSGGVVHINSSKDFSQITESTTGLKVFSLDNIESISFLDTEINDKIQRLELCGAVSRVGLEMLFTKFRFIQYLYVNVDKVMIPSYSRKSPLTFNMPQLTSIFVENSEKTKLFDWPVRIETPRLRKLKVVDAVLNKDNFKQLQQFVANVQETLEEIEITQCFICEECDLADVQYDNLVKIAVSKRRLHERLGE